MQILITNQAEKKLRKLNSKIRERIRNALNKLPLGDIKKLKGFKNDYRLKIGDYRIIYEKENNIITIKDILPRENAYKKLKRS